jgi:hypothetical protein
MNSPREILIGALEDVEQAGLPDDLREVGFAKAIDLRAAPAAAGPSSASGGVANPTVVPTPADLAEDNGNGSPIATIAGRLQIAPDTVSEVFATHGGDLEVIVSVGRLSNRAATATKEIALLVAGGRQAAGLDEWTSWDEIRRWCAEFKKLDSPNFAKTMREMDDVFNTRKASVRKLQVRLAKPGWERLGDEIRRLGGEVRG